MIEKKPSFQGWSTTDAEEIERRRWRGSSEIVLCEPLEAGADLFRTYRVRSFSGTDYLVEIRSLVEHENSCGCRDFSTNGLGTCKHIEGALEHLRREGKRRFNTAAKSGGTSVEIYPAGRGEPGLRILWPSDDVAPELRDEIVALTRALEQSAAGARQALHDFAAEAFGTVRLSRYLGAWLDDREARALRLDRRVRFLADVEAGHQSLDLLAKPLLPYQVDGVLHLAFGERSLLADDMGLGKTVQAIAACELLRRLQGIKRVLVVSPASLKAEWEDQIARFTDLPSQIVVGPRAKRLAQYREAAFFTLTNYEQIIADGADINRILAPDVVILDEAQRIKNWQTKTARSVKALRSPYAFVLTGTPLENRIDEVYSIVQYLDPGLLGPLFRFNRDFYVLDDRGRPIDYQNLDQLRQRLEPVMLRRRKTDVETQLPGRTVDNFFVGMTEEQRLRYVDYERPAQRIIAQAQRRPLLKAEFERLQQLLACMRMTCDTPYILDPQNRDCPKLEELERILADVLAEDGRKIIIFSEWVRMLELVRELAVELGVEFAWHTGSVPQDRRRAEINRFKKDPACRLFLSSDSGGVGLNLQAADTVINLDLPWNPAKLEQRIARAWRKFQPRAVSVINLVCENSIEHRMLFLLNQKQGLADAVLDGRGDLSEIRMPTGRAAFVERMEAMLAEVESVAREREDPLLTLRDDLLARHGEDLLSISVRVDEAGQATAIVVLDRTAAGLEEERQRLGEQTDCAVELVDRASFEAIRRLEASGLLRFNGDMDRDLHRSPRLDKDDQERLLERARQLAGDADHKLRMASLLAGGGFETESLQPAKDALGLSLLTLAVASGMDVEDGCEPSGDLADSLAERDLLPVGSRGDVDRILAFDAKGETDVDMSAEEAIGPVRELLIHARQAMDAVV